MKKLLYTTLVVCAISFVAPVANAQMMGGFSNSSVDWDEVVEHTLLGEQEGKALWDQLQAKETSCENLNDEQFAALGEYYMGQMAGDSHAAMNAMMMQTHGEAGEEQIHVVMGKRPSGCDTAASFPAGSGGMMSMMMGGGMMGGGSFNGADDGWFTSDFNNRSNNSMMNFGSAPFGWFGWIFMILWWVLVIVGIVALVKWLVVHSRGVNGREKTALDILKERYAKGEIDKQEFEGKKEDLLAGFSNSV